MPDFLTQLWGLLGDFFTSNWWGGITAIVLIVTLIQVIKYVKATKGLAVETKRMADMAETRMRMAVEEFDLRTRPMISVSCNNTRSFADFRTRIINISAFSASLRIKVSLTVDGTVFPMPEDSLYGGIILWGLIAKRGVNGHFGIHEFEGAPADAETKNIRITFEYWVINSRAVKRTLFDDDSKQPPVQYYWEPNRKIWIPEVSPITAEQDTDSP